MTLKTTKEVVPLRRLKSGHFEMGLASFPKDLMVDFDQEPEIKSAEIWVFSEKQSESVNPERKSPHYISEVCLMAEDENGMTDEDWYKCAMDQQDVASGVPHGPGIDDQPEEEKPAD
jgi:hypothetical protein